MKTRIANTLLLVTLWCIAVAEPLPACQSPVIEEDAENPRQFSTDGLIITWSETNDELRGFSQKHGEWEVLKIDPQKLNPGQIINPTVADNVAAVRCGDSIAAFSADKGWWDVIDLAKGSKEYPNLSSSLVKIEDNGHLYTFSSSKGQWSSPTDPELKPATFEYSFKRGEVDDGREQFEAWLKQLPQHEARRISMMSSNGVPYLITTTRQSTMKVARQKIEEFWCPKKPVAKEATPDPEPKRSSAEIDSQITKFREDLAKLESTVQAGLGKHLNPGTDQEQQTKELWTLVEQSFDLRQQLHRLEAERLRLKLQLIETNLSAREKSREAIIARRVEALQSGDGEQSPASSQSQGAGGPIDGAPIGLSGPPQLSTSTQAGRDADQGRNTGLEVDSSRSKVAGRLQLQQPTEIMKNLLGFRQNLREYESRREYIQRQIDQWSQPFEKLVADKVLSEGNEELRKFNLQSGQDQLAAIKQTAADELSDWNYAWSYYQAQLQLLRLDVQEAKSEADALAAQHVRLAKLHSAGNVAQERLGEVIVAFTAAKINLQRAEQVLKLYTDIEANEPVLNPAFVSPEWKQLTNSANAASVPATAAAESKPSQSWKDLLNNTMTQGAPSAGGVVGSWHEVLEIADALTKRRSEFEVVRAQIEQTQIQLAQYRTPLSEWKPEDSAHFRSTFEVQRKFGRRGDGSTLEIDIAYMVVANKDKYLQERLVAPRIFNMGLMEGRQFDLVDITDSVLNRIRLDMVVLLEARTKQYEARQQETLQPWKAIWNAYMDRRKLLELDVQEQKARLEDAKKLKALAEARQAGGSDSTAPESAVRLAEIQLQRAEATLKPYMDIEAQNPELNPDYVAPEKPQPESAAKP